jgi:hypothetical protein
MTVVGKVQKDILDLTTNYITKEKPREFFKSIQQLFFWTKYLTGKETSSTLAALSSFGKVIDAFNLLDLAENLNNLRNHLSGKKVQDSSLLVSDTLNSTFETTAWLSVSTGIISLSKKALRWTMIGDGITLMFSFAKYAAKDIKEYLYKPLTKNEKNIKLLTIANDVALFAIGALLFISSWFEIPLMITSMTAFGAVCVIANFSKYVLEQPLAV